MRIGINCLGMNDKQGGLRQYGQRLIRELLDNDADNDYIIFHTNDNLHEIELIGSERMRSTARPVSGYAELFTQLDALDVYFCPFNLLWPRPVPVPSVVNLSDIQEVFYPQFFTGKVLDSRRRHYPPSTRTANSVLTVSEFSKRSIVEHHGISPDKVFVAYHAVDESMFAPSSTGILQKFNLPERFIFYPANYWLHKNHDALLRALHYLRTEKNCIVPCVLTGQEVDDGYPIKGKISGFGLDNQVKVLGYVTNEEIRALFHAADMLCFPSLFEGFGMPLVDAMAAGLPVTCSTVASIPEVVGDAALLFEPENPVDIADKIQSMWIDAQLREGLVVAGKERVKLFTAANMAKVHIQAFRAAYDSFDSEGREFYRHEIWGPMKQFPQMHYQILNLSRNIQALQSSLSWRLTAPLRKILDVVKKKD